jgi:hypothetical protein
MLEALFGSPSKQPAVAATGTNKPVHTTSTCSIPEVATRYTTTVTRRSDAVERELARVTEKLATLLPIETTLKTRFETELARLKAEQQALDRGLDKKFKRLDMGFMRLNKGIYPAFALFDLSKPPTCEVQLITSYGGHGSNEWKVYCRNLPNLMCSYANFQPLMEDLIRQQRNSDLRLWTTFTGVMPDDVRDLINQSKADFDELVLVAEVEEWSKSPAVRAGDPLVIGRVGPLWWLIAKFDTTPFEQYVSKEFTTEL